MPKNESVVVRYLGVFLGLLLGGFALLWLYTAHARANFLPETYGTWRAVLSMARSCDTSDVAVIGASQASVGVIPHRLGLGTSVKNYSLTTTTPVEGYYLARRLFQCPSPPKVVVLSYSGFDFAGSDYFWEHSAKFGLLSFKDLQEISAVARQVGDGALYHRAFGAEPPPPMKNFLYASHFPPFDSANLLAAQGFRRRAANDRITAEALASGGQHLLSNTSCSPWLGWEAYEDSFHPSRLDAVYFDRLLDLLHAHGATVLFVSPPMSDRTYREMHGRYGADFTAFIAGTQRRHPELRVVGPLFPTMDHCYFTDALHLNQRGAEIFSEQTGLIVSSALGGWKGGAAIANETPPLSARPSSG